MNREYEILGAFSSPLYEGELVTRSLLVTVLFVNGAIYYNTAGSFLIFALPVNNPNNTN